MRKLLFGCLVLLSVSVALAAGDRWVKVLNSGVGDSAYAVAASTSGGCVIAGSSGDHAFVAMLDRSGRLVWTKFYSSGEADIIRSISPTSDGGYVLAGASNSDAVVVRVDAFGDIVWQKAFHTSGSDIALQAKQTSDGGFVVVGVSGGSRGFIIKLDSLGKVQWEKHFEICTPVLFKKVLEMSDGYVALGQIGDHMLLMKFNFSGSVVWSKDFFGSGFDVDAGDIIQPSSGGVIVAGSTNEGLLLMWVDAQGSLKWHIMFKGGKFRKKVFSVLNADNGFILAGGGDNAFLIKTDVAGNIIWQKVFPWGTFYGLTRTSDGSYVAVGSVLGDVIAMKFGEDGSADSCLHPVEDRVFFSPQAVSLRTGSLGLSSSGNFSTMDGFMFHVEGNFELVGSLCAQGTQQGWTESGIEVLDSGEVDFATYVQCLSGGGFVVSGKAGNDALIMRFSPSGGLLWKKVFGSGIANSVKETADGGYVVCGISEEDAFVVKFGPDGFVQWQSFLDAGTLDGFMDIIQTSDKGYLAVGFAGGDVLVAKFSSSGAVQWLKVFDSGSSDEAQSVLQTQDGGYILVGTSKGDGFVAKLSGTGDIQWQYRYDVGSWDKFYSVRQTKDGGLLVAGVSGTNAVVAKLDAAGSVEWERVFFPAGFREVYPTADGGCIVVGSIFDISFPLQAFYSLPSLPLIVKLDALGNVEWEKSFSMAVWDFASAASVCESSDGYIVAGEVGDEILVAKFAHGGGFSDCGKVTDIHPNIKNVSLTQRSGELSEASKIVRSVTRGFVFKNVAFESLLLCPSLDSNCAPRDLPSKRTTDIYGLNESPDYLWLQNGGFSLCLSYGQPVTAFVLVFNSEFTDYRWLASDCTLKPKNRFEVFMEGVSSGFCSQVRLPFEHGWLAWLVFGKSSVAGIDWAHDPYMLGAKQF